MGSPFTKGFANSKNDYEYDRSRWLELPLPQPLPLRRDDPTIGDVGEDEEDQERDGGRRVIVIDFRAD